MFIYVGHALALRAWLDIAASRRNYTIVERKGMVDCVSGIRQLRHYVAAHRLLSGLSKNDGEVIDLLVTQQSMRHQSASVTTHLWSGELPPGSLAKVEGWPEGVYLSTPGFCLLQLAACVELPLLVKYVMDLCGRYAVGNYRPQAITTKGELLAYARTAHGFYGAKNLVAAIELAIENSWSPGETVSYLLMFLPPELGGCMEHPIVMNDPLVVPENLRGFIGQGSIIPDMRSLTCRMLLQYNGKADHMSLVAQLKDQKWEVVARAMGFEVRTLNALSIANVDEFERFAQEFFACMGFTFTPRRGDAAVARNHLRALLLPQMGIT